MLASRHRWCTTIYEALHSRALQALTRVLRCPRPRPSRGCGESKRPWEDGRGGLQARARLACTGPEAAIEGLPGLQSLSELAADILEVETPASAAVSTREKVLIAIDPDNSGAIAIAKLQADGSSMLSLLLQTDVTLHDMPCLRVSVGKRHRRQADPAAIVEIVQQSIQRIGDSTEDMHCILEEPVPNPANGRQSVFGTGYAFGVWSGVLSTSGISLETVTARRWKGDLGLNKCGKDGSRILAAALFPKAVSLLRRKKDHGRAEALLILAWALGLRLPKTSQSALQMLESSGGAVEGLTESSSSESSGSEEEAPVVESSSLGISDSVIQTSHIFPPQALQKVALKAA